MKPSYLKAKLLFLVLLALSGSLILPSSAANATAERCHPHDKRALLRIKQQLSLNYSAHGGWDDPTTDCCDWYFIQCDDTTNRVISFIMLFTDNEGTPFPSALGDLPYLEEVNFHNNATGPIPSSLAKLRRLIALYLNFNLLTGPIPSFFSTFQNLTILDLSNNLLTGSLPPSLALAQSLTNLYLNSNKLTGPIPSFFSTFQNLTELDLSNNLFTGSLPPSLALAPSLRYLVLSRNKLTGPIPKSFGSFKNKQLQLLLADNLLSGEIPKSLEKVKFVGIDVSGNKLEGDASFLFGNDKTATNIILNDNSLSFDMTNLGFPHLLNILKLNNNEIYGSLPEGLAHLPILNHFNVSYNRLCGRIPTGGTLKQFNKTTYFHNKCLCGTPLPSCK